MSTFTGRQVGSLVVSLVGLGIVISGIPGAPGIWGWWAGANGIDRADVVGQYFWWSLIIGIGFIVAAQVFERTARYDNLLSLGMVVGLLVAGDRFLLARAGLPLWKHDPVLRYRHRPGAVRRVHPGAPRDRTHVINRFGHHDTEFPVEKPTGELRGLILGDSVTMGYGVPYRETFSAQLEGLLAKRDRKHPRHEVINTGVHGYATAQEKVVLERSLRFDPDYVVLGFCMNDVVEPFVVDAELGGVGLDYHEVTQTPSPVMGWLLNETGVGRRVQGLQARGKTREAEKRKEIYGVRDMAVGLETEPRFKEAWALVERSLDEIVRITRARDLPLLLVAFPYTFQLKGDDTLRTPQRKLREFAESRGIDYIDFTPAFRRAIYFDPELVQFMKSRGFDEETIDKFFSWRYGLHFFDEDHFQEAGHQIVAEGIYDWLGRRGLVQTATAAQR